MGLLGMVLGSLRLPLSDGMRTDGDSALGQLCDSGRAGPTWRWMAAALLWGWLRRAMEGVPSSVVLSSKWQQLPGLLYVWGTGSEMFSNRPRATQPSV